MATSCVIDTNRLQSFFNKLETRKTLLMTVIELFQSINNHFTSLEQSLALKSQTLDSKREVLDTQTKKALESLKNRGDCCGPGGVCGLDEVGVGCGGAFCGDEKEGEGCAVVAVLGVDTGSVAGEGVVCGKERAGEDGRGVRAVEGSARSGRVESGGGRRGSNVFANCGWVWIKKEV
ncbi:hypothetical protein F0562_012443 [Nyssa sinensis]|uniref:Uncharacterized protein n=1 Tax=Nyssa sinensis TaxID=561372 RepID=A0A5J4ZTS5_9ASTE|nr:hypothetical protein F0562_012443 [Nyssa sinensis]